MRLAELHLEAFGPFTDARLALDAPGPALHVVYGPNEAGKSTTLRALSGFFYGIPQRTVDAHRHPMQKLRVGAQLLLEGGESLEVVRKKGNKNTLLGAGGAPIDEARLTGLLHGIGREQFELMFGLDHVTLREGAAALLESGGDLGESLYGASLGAGIHEAISRLEAEARELFAARGQKPALNAAISEFKEAQRVLRSNIKLPDGYQTQLAALEEARAAQGRTAEYLAVLRTEHEKMKRAVRVIPGLATLRLLLAEREALGDVPRITPEAIAKRRAADKAANDAAVQLGGVTTDLDRLRAKRAALPSPDAAAELGEDEAEALGARLAEHNKAESDLPHRHAELTGAEREAGRLLRELRRAASIEEARELLPSAPEREAIQTLASRHGEIATRVAAAREELEKAARELDRLRTEADEADASGDLSALEAAEARARKLGDAETELVGRQAELVERTAELDRLVAALPGFEGDATAAGRLKIPEQASVERRAEERIELEDALRTRERSAVQTAEKLDRVTTALEADQLEGEVPSEAQLGDERRERDRLWSVIRRTVDGPSPPEAEGTLGLDLADPDAFEDALGRTDETADRLRREAARVAEHARLVAEQAELERRAGAQRALAEEARSALAAHDRQTRDDWAALGVEIEDARAATPWVARHADVLRSVRQLEEQTRGLREFEAKVAAAKEGLRSALEAAGHSPSAEAGLSALLHRAQGVIEAARERRAEHRARVARREQLEHGVVELGRAVETREAALAEWREQWGARLSALGAGPTAMPEEALALLRSLEEFDKRLLTADKARERIEKMERDARSFGEELDRITSAVAPDLAEGTHAERGRALLRRARDAREVARARHELDGEIAGLEERKAGFEGVVARAEAELSALCEAAGAGDRDALIAAEERAAEASRLDERIAETRGALLREGRSIEELTAETDGLEKGQAAGRADDIEREIDEQVEAHSDAVRLVRDREFGLEKYETQTGASDAASDAAGALAKVRETAHRYVRLRLAVTILRAEIARYRDENQAPLLAHATKLFPRLTLGRYTRLQVGHEDGDAPVLRCVREDGEDVGIDALSDGTKDQLYLALRLASLIRFAEQNGPLPLILDDCLVHFDDDRSRAALAVLGEVSEHFQILFFTHHARLVELAREAVPKDRLQVTNLAPQ